MRINRPFFVLLLTVFLLYGCSTVSKKPASVVVDQVPSKPEVQPPKTPVEQLKQSLDEQYSERVAQAIIQETRDAALKIDLMTSLEELRVARNNIRKLDARGGAQEPSALEQGRDRDFWVQKYNSHSKELRDLIEASAEMFWIDFLVFNKKDLTAVGYRELEHLGPSLSKWCALGREVIVAGFGCSIGGEEGTLIVSSLRAKNTANWITGHSKCKKSQIANIGMGMIVDEVYWQAASTPAGEELLAQKRHALVLVLRDRNSKASEEK